MAGVKALSPVDLAWLAGLYEGEGTLGCYRAGDYYQIALIIQMNDRDVIEMVHEITGVGVLTIAVPKPPYDWNPVHRWKVSKRDDVADLVRVLWPWLFQRRREQALKALTSYMANSTTGWTTDLSSLV